MKIAVLGGGIAGLASAWRLAEGGAEVIVIEREPQPGGLAGSVRAKGCTIDFGPHGWALTDYMKPEFFKVMKEEECLLVKKNVKILFQGRYYRYPLETIDVVKRLNPAVAFIYFVDFLFHNIKRTIFKPIDTSAETWYINRFGRSFYNQFFRDYTEKVWGLPPAKIAASFTESRVPLLNFLDVFKRTINGMILRLTRKDLDLDAAYLNRGYYPKGGSIVFPERLMERIVDKGGKVFLNSTMRRIELLGARKAAVTFQSPNGEVRHECDYIVSSLPVNEMVLMIEPAVPEPVQKAARAMLFRALLYVNMIVKRTPIFDSLWIYFRNRTYNRVAEMTKFDPAVGPADKAVLCAEITCYKDDDLWNMDEMKLCEQVAKELQEDGFIRREEIEEFVVTRSPHGYPVSTLTHREDLEALLAYINGIENLLTTGRQGLFRYLQMDHCYEMGYKVAEHILGEKKKSEHKPDVAGGPAFS